MFKYAPYLHFSDSLYYRSNTEAVAQRCSVKKVFLEILQDSQENTCVSLFNKIKKRFWLVQVFSCEFWEISKNTFSYRTPLVAASGNFSGNLRANKIIRFP